MWQCVPLPWRQVDLQDKKLRWGVIWEDGECEFFIIVRAMNFLGRGHPYNSRLSSSFGMGFGRTDETGSRSRKFVGIPISYHAWTMLTNVSSTPPPIVEGFSIGLQLCFSDAGECHPPAFFT